MKNSSLSKILKLAHEGKYDTEQIEDIFTPLLENGMSLKVREKGTQYISGYTELRAIHIVLSGRCRAVKYTFDGKTVVVDSTSGFQMLGLYELLNGRGYYTSTVETIDKCYFLEIPLSYIKNAIYNDIDVCHISIDYLAKLADRSISKNYIEMVNTSVQNFILYLYNNCLGLSFPCRIEVDRKTMASELNVSMRSIYRYTNELKRRGMISILCGKILVSEEQFRLLEEASRKFL